jgi:site-specific DNA-cytosine methylase
MKSSNPNSGCREVEVARTIDTTYPDPSKNQGGVAVVEAYPQEIHNFVAENNADAPHQQDLLQTADGIARTLAPGTHAAGSHLTKTIIRVGTRYTVRRLTPLECERLQGYPDGWTDIGEWTDSNGKKRQTSDAARYKALGNSIALPPWKWVLKRLCACYERDATMASLFDGIGGFPYLWEQLNGKGSCLWASEIDEFPMAVTKVRIGE